uniref:Ig-like domain-containing protein n=1 Tax=Stomoxys calcitrans TaxID=35570 RepID=A0A1I8NLZ5_STOCA
MAFLLHTILFVAIGFSAIYGIKDVPQKHIEAISGETIYLPCNVSINEGDEVVLILWYREDRGTPIYSVDIREGVKKSIKRWSDENIFGERAYFILDKEPGTLSIQSTMYTDSGTYRCRVDFLKAQTRNSKIIVTVIDSDNDSNSVSETAAELRDGDSGSIAVVSEGLAHKKTEKASPGSVIKHTA